MISISDIEGALKKQGSLAFKSIQFLELIPKRVSPIKLYVYGAGAFAAVFKVRHKGKIKALRCFLNDDRAISSRYEAINSLKLSFLVDCEFFQDELLVNNRRISVVLMDWCDGISLGSYVMNHLGNIQKLDRLQMKLIEIHKALESKSMAHGDLQSGNIMVSDFNGKLSVKLIDYDCFYLPKYSGTQAPENGHLSYQHPKRTLSQYNEHLDRFSMLVILNGIEVAKYYPDAWAISTGFNDGDNFLFTGFDFVNLDSSLWKFFDSCNSEVKHYAFKIRSYLQTGTTDLPTLIKNHKAQPHVPVEKSIDQDSTSTPNKIANPRTEGKSNEPRIEHSPVRIGHFLLESNDKNAIVYNTFLKPVGSLPIYLNASEWEGKTVVVRGDGYIKNIKLSSNRLKYQINI